MIASLGGRAAAHLMLACLLVSTLPGCRTSLASIRDRDMAVATIRVPSSAVSVVDRREGFAAYFCDNLRKHAVPADAAKSCREWLRLSDQLAPVAPPHPAPARPRPIVIIPGIFGECVAKSTTPFSDAYALLRERGHRIHVLEVEGRSSSAKNGRTVDQWMAAHAPELEDAVVIAYSKGTTDFMHAAVLDANQRRWLDRIAALVTVSGVVNGTPLASRGAKPYNDLFANIPVPACGIGDEGGVQSLSYRDAMGIREQYLKTRPPVTYAVVAITDSKSVNPVLAPFHDQLDELDERNDGQVLIEDAVLPGSQLIASASADHWSITLPFETSGKDVRFLSRKNHFPRVPFALALIDFLNATSPENAP